MQCYFNLSNLHFSLLPSTGTFKSNWSQKKSTNLFFYSLLLEKKNSTILPMCSQYAKGKETERGHMRIRVATEKLALISIASACPFGVSTLHIYSISVGTFIVGKYKDVLTIERARTSRPPCTIGAMPYNLNLCSKSLFNATERFSYKYSYSLFSLTI